MIGYRKGKLAVYDPFTNYCGPNYSDGQVQPSVLNGKLPPLNARDANCQAHDTCYAFANGDSDNFDRCDESFYKSSKTTGLIGKAYGYAVLYGNRTLRSKNSSLRGTTNSNTSKKMSLYNPYSSQSYVHPTQMMPEDRRRPDDGTCYANPGDAKPDSINSGGSYIGPLDDRSHKPGNSRDSPVMVTLPGSSDAPKPGAGDNPPIAGQGFFGNGAYRIRRFLKKKKKKHAPKPGAGGNPPKPGHGAKHNFLAKKNKKNRVHLE